MKRITTIFTMLFLWFPALGHAQDRNAQGLELNDKGIEAFEAGRYTEAADSFQKAYDILGDPAIRKNEALAWFKAEECDNAVAAANKFLLLEGTVAEDHREMETVIANCKVTIARKAVDAGEVDVAKRLLAEAEQLEPDAYVQDQIKLVRIEIAKRENPEADPAEDPALDAAAAAPEPRAPILEYTLIGAGGALFTAGLLYHVIALGWQSEFLRMTTEGGDSQRFESLRDRVHTARVVVPILYGLGIAGAATGVALLMMYEPADPSVAASSGRLWLGFSTTF